MPSRIDLDKYLLKEAIELIVASRTRASRGASNNLIKEIYEKDIGLLNAAIPTIADLPENNKLR